MKRLALFIMISLFPLSCGAAAHVHAEIDDRPQVKNKGGSFEVNKIEDTNLMRREEELRESLQQGDVGVVSSEAIQDSGAPASSLVNKHLPQSSGAAYNKGSFGLSVKNAQQLLKKHLIIYPRLQNWWKQISEHSFFQNTQSKQKP